MFVVAIVSLIASLAIPRFIAYQWKSKATEVRMIMGGIRASQESFFATRGNYANITEIEPDVLSGERKPWPNTPCDNGCVPGAEGACNQFSCIGYVPSSGVFYQYEAPSRNSSSGSTQEFAIGARGDIDFDSVPSGWGWRTSNDPGALGAGVFADSISGCPANVPAYEIIDCTPNIW